MQKIYIKSPWVDSSKYLPHLVEHCALSTKYTSYNYILDNVEGRVGSAHTEFSFPDFYNISDVVSLLCRPFDSTSFLLEKARLKEELGEKLSRESAIYEKIGRQFDPDFSMKKHEKNLYQNALEYHREWYKSENFYTFSEIQKVTQKGNAKNIFLVNSEKYQMRGIKIKNFIFKKNPETQFLLYCLEFLVYHTSSSYQRQFFKSYYTQEHVASYIYKSYCAFSVGISDLGLLMDDGFETFLEIWIEGVMRELMSTNHDQDAWIYEIDPIMWGHFGYVLDQDSKVQLLRSLPDLIRTHFCSSL